MTWDVEFHDEFEPEFEELTEPVQNEEKNPEGRWRKYSYEQLTARDKTTLDVSWLKDKSLTDLDNLPESDELAQEIIDNIEAGLNSFREIVGSLEKRA